MNKLHPSNLFSRIFITVILGISVNSAHSTIIIDNWNLTANSLTFDLVGTVDTVGVNDINSFFIGPPNSIFVNWINNGLTGGIVTQNGGTYTPTNIGAYENNPHGEYIYTNGSNITVGMLVDLSLSFSSTNLFNPGALNTNDLIVSAGYNSTPSLPDPSAQTGGIASVPEPSIIALMGLGLLGFSATRRKIQK